MKGKARDVPVRPSDPLPFAVVQNLAPRRARRILDHRQPVSARERQDRREIARHPHLVRAENRARPRRDRRLDSFGSDVESRRLDFNEHRHRAAVTHRARRGDERMADGHHLIARAHARAHARGEQCEMQRRGAARHRARLRRTHGGGEFIFKGRSLRPHREPAREDHAPCGGGSGLAGFGQAERDVWG